MKPSGWLAALLLPPLFVVGCAVAPAPVVVDTDSTAKLLDRISESLSPQVPFVGEEKVLAKLAPFRDDKTPGTFDQRLRLAAAYVRTGEAEEATKLYEELRAEATRRGMPEAERIDRIDFPRAVAFLRLGEQQTCVGHHTADSCLFPIKGKGIHVEPEGSIAAAAAFAEILEKRPGDTISKWLLNVATMTLGRDLSTLPEKFRLDPAAWKPKADFPVFKDVAGPLGMAVRGLAGGVVIDDFDGDGYLDVMASASFPLDSWGGQLRLFHNEKDGTYRDATEEAGLIGIRGGLNLIQGDVDGNGFPDVLVLRGAWQLEDGNWPETLLANDHGKFTDVTVKAGILGFEPTQAAVFSDFDRDGHLDLFIGIESGIPQRKGGILGSLGSGILRGVYSALNRRVPAHLYRNRGDGTFEDVLPKLGLGLSGWIKGAVAGDYDRDGRPDLYLSRYGDQNLLLHNDSVAPGKIAFSDRTEKAGVGDPVLSFSTWFFDENNDGWPDLFVGGYPYAEVNFGGSGLPFEFKMSNRNELRDFLGEPIDSDDGIPRLFRNKGDGTFEDVTKSAGLWHVMAVMGANFGDLDGDGYLDLAIGTGTPPFYFLVPNRIFRNRGGRGFEEVTVAANMGTLAKGHGIGFGDLDNDGDQDVYEVLGGAYPADVYPNALFENPGFGHDWITLKLEGTTANRSALGARVEVDVDGPGGARKFFRTIGSGGSFGASTLRAEIGLGPLATHGDSIRNVIVTWPDAAGTKQELGPLAKNSFYTVRQGEPAVSQPLAKLRLVTGEEPPVTPFSETVPAGR